MPVLRRPFLLPVLLVLLAGAANAQVFGPGDEEQGYVVTVTNLTANLTFSPVLLVLHDDRVSLYELGEPASDMLEALAEAGDSGPLAALAEEADTVSAAATGVGPVFPGGSAEIAISGAATADVISVAAMLLPTNDGFVAASGLALPAEGAVVTEFVPAYDAGTELNDELCVSIPGLFCGGSGLSAEDGEGYVHVHRGIHGIGSLNPALFDWRNPVALVTVRRGSGG